MNFSEWEKMKIAGMPEQNRQIDELRKRWESQQEFTTQMNAYENISDELRKSNEIMQAQIDEAENEAKSAKRKAFWASFRSWLSIAITAGSLVVAIVALCSRVAP